MDTLDLDGFNETKSAYNKDLDELFNCLVHEELHVVEDVNVSGHLWVGDKLGEFVINNNK